MDNNNKELLKRVELLEKQVQAQFMLIKAISEVLKGSTPNTLNEWLRFQEMLGRIPSEMLNSTELSQK